MEAINLFNMTDKEPSTILKGYRTYVGIAMLIIPSILRGFGIEVTEADLQVVVENVLVTIGSIVAIYGRYNA